MAERILGASAESVGASLPAEAPSVDTPLTAWPRCSKAAEFLEGRFGEFTQANPRIADLAAKLHDHAGVDLRALIDHWVFAHGAGVAAALRECGFVHTPCLSTPDDVWEHPAGRLPRVRLTQQTNDEPSTTRYPKLAIAVECPGDFLRSNHLSARSLLGDPDSEYEEAICSQACGELAVVARRGYRGFHPSTLTPESQASLARVRALIDARSRDGDESRIIAETESLFNTVTALVGRDRAVDEFFAGERRFYMSRNAAAVWQYARQQDMGIGWANYDHHTYRSSRQSFRPLMRLWRTMGFVARERYYAGADAGWGAQIFEHPVSRVVIFSDVDMKPEELHVDFETTDLDPLRALGTIGLWCALHGSSIGAAGMHHLEAEFDFAAINKLLPAFGYPTMKPFTDLPILKQAFTEPEFWTVQPARLTQLVNDGFVTQGAADRFAREGAPGSHLEVLQRWDGFKGFNKTGISNIIRDTDARYAQRR